MKKFFFFFLIFFVYAIVFIPNNVLAQGQSGTTLTADKTAVGHLIRTYNWDINKSVSPSTWHMFKGDSGTSHYIVEVTKTAGEDIAYVDGEICVTNGGDVVTQELKLVDQVEYKLGSGQFQPLSGASQEITPEQLNAGERKCYPYKVEFSPIEGAIYRNSVKVTITNHSGQLGMEFGPEPKADFSLPSTPTEVNDAIDVTDSNGGSWKFNNSGSIGYDKSFYCDADEGRHENTATIDQTGQSDTVAVDVACYNLQVSKTANTDFQRDYTWNIDKSVDQNKLTLALGQQFNVNYTVGVSATYQDSNWSVNGDIEIYNPAPFKAVIKSVNDIVSDDIVANVVCPVSFPYDLAPESSLICSYTAGLPDASVRINSASVYLQNYDYTADINAQSSGTTEFSGTADIDFTSADVDYSDQCVTIEDSLLRSSLGEVCYDQLPMSYNYLYQVGPYDKCGVYQIENTATLKTIDTEQTKTDTINVDIDIPCNLGCTLTIGYWKNHAGFGPQDDMVTALLPQTLGYSNILEFFSFLRGKSLIIEDSQTAVNVFNMRTYGSPSNGITKLYAQLLAAKLNIASGASDNLVASVINDADKFLLNKSYLDWNSLSKADKNKVLQWANILDQFNNGHKGPLHCSE